MSKLFENEALLFTSSDSPKVIGLSGYKRSGKDTFTKLIKEKIEKEGYSVEVIPFADPIKKSLCALLNITLQELEDLKNNDYPIEYSVGAEKVSLPSGRALIQRYGEECLKDHFGKDIFVDIMIKAVSDSKADFVIIPDFRLLNEFNMMEKRFDCTFAYIQNKHVVSTDTHPTEVEFTQRIFDAIVTNNFNALDEETHIDAAIALDEQASSFVNKTIEDHKYIQQTIYKR